MNLARACISSQRATGSSTSSLSFRQRADLASKFLVCRHGPPSKFCAIIPQGGSLMNRRAVERHRKMNQVAERIAPYSPPRHLDGYRFVRERDPRGSAYKFYRQGSLQSSQNTGCCRCRQTTDPGLSPMRKGKPVPSVNDWVSASKRIRKDKEEGTEYSRGGHWGC